MTKNRLFRVLAATALSIALAFTAVSCGGGSKEPGPDEHPPEVLQGTWFDGLDELNAVLEFTGGAYSLRERVDWSWEETKGGFRVFSDLERIEFVVESDLGEEPEALNGFSFTLSEDEHFSILKLVDAEGIETVFYKNKFNGEPGEEHFAALLTGDFSAFAGIWEDDRGDVTLLRLDGTLHFEGGATYGITRGRDGTYGWDVFTEGAGGIVRVLYPVGVEGRSLIDNSVIPTDTSRVRLCQGHEFPFGPDDFYYRK